MITIISLLFPAADDLFMAIDYLVEVNSKSLVFYIHASFLHLRELYLKALFLINIGAANCI